MRPCQIARCVAVWVALPAAVGVGGVGQGAAAGPLAGHRSHPPNGEVALRAQSFPLPPTNQPAAPILIKNLRDEPYRGTVQVQGPADWLIVPPRQDVSLRPGETKRILFTVEKGLAVEANCYRLKLAATGDGQTVTRSQNVVCAAAPYYKPAIDGDPSDWGDALPVTFTTGGKKTVVKTFWNRRQFSLLVAVQEDRLLPYREGGEADGFDAVQLALAPRGTQTGTSPDDEARRFEFLFVSTGAGSAGKCFRLSWPGMALAEAARFRKLGPLEYDEATVAVSRTKAITYYECGLSFRPMRKQIEPIEGREFYLSVLVHDRDGTGLRDWGQAAGLWPWQRNPLAWSRFPGVQWGDKPPFDSKVLWAFYSSKY